MCEYLLSLRERIPLVRKQSKFNCNKEPMEGNIVIMKDELVKDQLEAWQGDMINNQ